MATEEPRGFRRFVTMRDINRGTNPNPQWEAKRWGDYVGMVAWLGAIAIILAFVFWGTFKVISALR